MTKCWRREFYLDHLQGLTHRAESALWMDHENEKMKEKVRIEKKRPKRRYLNVREKGGIEEKRNNNKLSWQPSHPHPHNPQCQEQGGIMSSHCFV